MGGYFYVGDEGTYTPPERTPEEERSIVLGALDALEHVAGEHPDDRTGAEAQTLVDIIHGEDQAA